MGTCLISTVNLWNLSWKLIDCIYTMSSSNAMPNALPEQLYLELQPDNFRLSQICQIQKEICGKELQKKLKPPRFYVASSLSSLSATLPNLWHCREPYRPWNQR